MSKKMSVEQALGTLIATANPYPKGGAMHFVAPKADAEGVLQLDAKGVPLAGDISLRDIQVEEDSRYPGEWMFKGQPQRIAKAVRIQYQYTKKGHNGEWYLVTDYLLVGFEGTGAG
jgi:hypothetical protein